MTKKVIKIDSDKCIGCGICANTCQQSAIEMRNGKAVVASENSCDGIGNCLPVCPVNAISFSDKDITVKNTPPAFNGCPGNKAETFKRSAEPVNTNFSSELNQWPVQIKLVPESAPYFNNAGLLIAADCSAFSYANFHSEFMRDKITIIGCPKLDSVDYTNKLTNIIKNNNVKSVTVVRMEVPCCGGIETATVNALKNSGKFIPWQVVTLSTNGKILSK